MALQIGPDHIVLLARRDVLRELAVVIGIQFPACLLFILTANLNLHSENRMLVRAPDRAEDYSVGFLALVCSGWSDSLIKAKFKENTEPGTD